MKKTLLAAASVLALTAAAQAEDVKMGIILGFTGPIESLTPDMAAGAEMAISEANESGQFLGGMTIEPVRADSTCVDAAAAFAAQQLGQAGQKRGLRGGPPVLDAARSAYLGAEYSGSNERRPQPGRVDDTEA